MTILTSNFFKILRPGTHTSFQDRGFYNLQHLGIATGGVIDNDLYILGNVLLDNDLKTPSLEFSLQGPCMKLVNGICRFSITGNVAFNIISQYKIIKGICNQTYVINKGDVLDILSTINSNYGYLSVEGGFQIKTEFDSYSTLTMSKIGSNNGKKLCVNQKIFFNKNVSNKFSKSKQAHDNKINFIRVVRGPQMNYFFPKIIKKFFNNSFKISKDSNRMGVRLEGNSCKPVESYQNISEGIIIGSVQITGDGNPIVLLNDHPTIGGYPKIAIVIMSDIHKIAQLPIGFEFKFLEISLYEAEYLFKSKIKNIKLIKNNINGDKS